MMALLLCNKLNIAALIQTSWNNAATLNLLIKEREE